MHEVPVLLLSPKPKVFLKCEPMTQVDAYVRLAVYGSFHTVLYGGCSVLHAGPGCPGDNPWVIWAPR